MPRVDLHTVDWLPGDFGPPEQVTPQELGYSPYDFWLRDVMLSSTGRHGDGFLTREELQNVIQKQRQSMNPAAAFALRESEDMLRALNRRNGEAVAYLPPALSQPELPDDPELARRVKEVGVTKASVRARATELLSISHELKDRHEIDERSVEVARSRTQEMRQRGDISERTADRAMLEIEIIARTLALAV